MLEWQWWPLLAVAGWGGYRLLGEWCSRKAASLWFGTPEPCSIRLFGRGQRRPIQSFKSLHVPTVGIHDPSKAMRKLESGLQRNRIEWGALADGLAVGAGAYAAVVASSAQAHANLLGLAHSLDLVDVGATHAASLSSAQQIGYQSWIQGQIGESVAASVLTAQGHQVTFAAVPNQPGWDLMIDGVPMNVKVGESAATNIGDHFDKYPHIEVITDTHTATILDHPMVHGLPGLEPDHIESLAQSTNLAGSWSDPSTHLLDGHWDGLHGVQTASTPEFADNSMHHMDNYAGGDVAGPDLHIPWITVGLGAFREVQLADKFGGSFGESLGAIAADAAGVAVGAKAGALAGAMLGPLGMIAGALIGGLLGKGVVNAARQSNVQAEIDRLNPQLASIDAAWERAAALFAVEAKQVVDTANRQLKSETEHLQTSYKREILELTKQHDHATVEFCRSIHQIFDMFDEWLNQDLLVVRKRFPKRKKWMSFLCPSKSESARALAEDWIASKKSELGEWRERFSELVAGEELNGAFDISTARLRLNEFVEFYKVWDVEAAPVLRESLDRFESIAGRATVAHKRAMAQVIAVLRSCEIRAQTEIEALWASREQSLFALAKDVDVDVRDLARRAARAHVTSFHPPLELFHRRSSAVKAGIKRNTSGADQLARLPALVRY